MAAEGEYKGEITGIVGIAHFPGSTNAMLGGEIGRAFGRRSQLFAETSYAPLGGGAKLLGLGGGFHFGFGKPGRFAPYATVMGGLGRFSG